MLQKFYILDAWEPIPLKFNYVQRAWGVVQVQPDCFLFDRYRFSAMF